ncbi:MAG TPA: imidazolonepropionase [Chitinophagaceae bacterium]|nr:imidazolonepropionase [Chitinophagaceae bacterium]
MRTLITHANLAQQYSEQSPERIKGKDMRHLPVMENAWLLVEDGIIHSFGSMQQVPDVHSDLEIDAKNGWLLPAWCDSHTHLVFAHSREHEFVDRIHGLSYEEIARRGGGILNSAKRLHDCPETELFEKAWQRLDEVRQTGTGAIEIKSGYGLYPEAELKMLRVIRNLKEKSDLDIKATFLAAHAYPIEYRENHEAYLKIVLEETLPRVADEGLADYIDVFCEKGFFSVEETDRILEAGSRYGLKAKIHANQLYNSGGVQVGVKHQAISVDHLETMDDAEIDCLLGSNTIPTLLPGAAFFLAMHYQPARKLIDAGLPVALASDYNPGSCPSGNMNLILTLACTQMKMTPEEAIHACTINGAAAMELSHRLGSLAVGMQANLLLTKPIPSLAYLPYAFGVNVIDKVMLKGKFG